MKRLLQISREWPALFFLSCLILACFFTMPLYAQDNEHKDMAGMAHDGALDPETIDELKALFPSLAEQSDEEIALLMQQMPSNYEWYISGQHLKGDVGVLILAHGYGETGDKIFKESIDRVADTYPAAIGFGMSMMGSSHIQSSVDDLVKAGATTIVFVPVVRSEFNSTLRQWDYILGKRDEASYLAVPRVVTEAEIKRSPPSVDHYLISEILLDHAKEISADPENEVVVIVGHGPEDPEENIQELALLDKHADYILQQGHFNDVDVINLQDDALKAIRAANVSKLRAIIQDASDQGRTVLIVGFLQATKGIQDKIQTDLEGLDYVFNAKGMSEHANYALWIEARVREELDAE